MIIPFIGIIIGAIVGVLGAKRRGGVRADMAQWGLVGAVILGVLGLFVMIILDRMLQ